MSLMWVVCVKQVPLEPVFKRVGDSYQVDRDRTEGILNPYDRAATHLALDLRAKVGGRVVVLSMGPPQAEEALREALACGADQAILLSDPVFAGADTLATAYTLSAGIRRLGNDVTLILCGARSLDSDTAQVGPQLAEFLGLPMAAYVDKASYKPGGLRVERVLDGRRERLLLSLPALITVAGRIRTESSLPLGSVEQAFGGVEVERWGSGDLGVEPGRVGWLGSATRAAEYAPWKRSRSGVVVRDRPGEAAERILAALVERGVLGGL